MSLAEITPESHQVVIELAYATARNLTGRPVYRRSACYLHTEAAAKLSRAVALAGGLGLGVKIFDAFRPPEAQWLLRHARPSPNFLPHPPPPPPHSPAA